MGIIFGDHPRACGEQNVIFVRAVFNEGSPPRMRGTAHRRYKAVTRMRITPAHAGNRPICPFARSRLKDHPRACGEQQRLFRAVHGLLGSPPRMRGTDFRCFLPV